MQISNARMCIFLLLVVFLTGPCTSNALRYCKQKIPRVCDYIIIGAGAAGIPAAARLSEDPDVNVCLFEAGPTDRRNVAIETPKFWTGIGFYPGEILWNHTTVPQKGLKDRSILTSTARVLGGSTSHNAMLYFRGFKNDFDNWEAKGAKGWSYRDVMPYFKKFENFEVSHARPDDDCGEVTVTQDPEIEETPMYKVLKRSTQQMNMPIVECNAPNPFGLCITQTTIESGQRVSSSTAYLRPIMGRRNLFIITDASVEKILISRRRNQAYGVKVTRNGETKIVKAKYEVVVSAGAIETPKLLQLSGVGPKDVLKKLGIRPSKILSVGENYHIHPLISMDLSLDVPTPTLKGLSDPETLADYVFKRKGPYAGSGIDYHLFVDIERQKRLNYPEVQISFGNSKTRSSISKENLVTGQPPLIERPGRQNGSHFGIFLARPKSRGFIRAISRNPREKPLNNPKMLSHMDDVRSMIKAIRVMQRMVQTPAMRRANADLQFLGPVPNECKRLPPGSNDKLECILRYQAGAAAHPVGTCKMGNPKDPTTVVDPYLRVKGIKGLRVADASVMPETTISNTMAPTILIGERVADFIKAAKKTRKDY